jgi:hypothetical protein
MPVEVGMSSFTMFSVGRLCVQPVCNSMAYLVNDLIRLGVSISPTSSQTKNQQVLLKTSMCVPRVAHDDRSRESTLLVIIINSHYYALDSC